MEKEKMEIENLKEENDFFDLYGYLKRRRL